MNQHTARRASIAAEVRAQLGRQNKTTADMSRATGISTATLSRRLNGLKPFYFEELEAVSSFLGVPVSALTARTDTPA